MHLARAGSPCHGASPAPPKEDTVTGRFHAGSARATVLFAACTIGLLTLGLSWLRIGILRAQTAEPESPAARFGDVEASGLLWTHLSSRHGDLPVPGESTEQ